ncbi:alkene reductase [Alsobacter metallidurans]|uniref:Alkene reductase n=1 Tax=Alsobacter metallidurans TaxID=340221 RepID=A0A917MHJ7_9HYPH|nr:alkene reductase [Alsobacter metallidurans]GGH20975.1 alkene reductase [Alsobacter metallidurans]
MTLLFKPTQLGALRLANSIVMAPLTRQRADAMGVPQPHVVDYYAQRASAGLIIAEGTQPSFAGQGYCRTPGIHTPEQIAAWKQVTDAVHARGGKIVLQIMHAGRIAHSLNRQIPDEPVAPSAVTPAGTMWTDQKQMQPYPAPRAFETAELPGLIEEFAQAARNAIAAGFDGVELHAANGYLLNQFLSSNTNQRADGYGSSVSGRIRFVVETTQAVAAAIGADRTGIRISPGHMFNDLVDANPLETHLALLDALPTADMAYVHVMKADSFAAALNNAGDPDAALQALRARIKGPMLAAGGYTAETGEAALQSGLIQAVVFGRPFIANPDLVERLRDGTPLAAPNDKLFYTPGPKGYSDYPSAH